jgi:hypothetical protein
MSRPIGLLPDLKQHPLDRKPEELPKPECGGFPCKQDPIVELLPMDHPGMFRVPYCPQHASQRIAELVAERGYQ